jgi:hypothetical protein
MSDEEFYLYIIHYVVGKKLNKENAWGVKK